MNTSDDMSYSVVEELENVNEDTFKVMRSYFTFANMVFEKMLGSLTSLNNDITMIQEQIDSLSRQIDHLNKEIQDIRKREVD